ncbi:MAG: hypothetical protein AVDCRST_MAG30-4669 [uncultured Solirubrobacteraceae bacterium]|uniref:Uncharacterized protein n=1 Tax=uncultured Solirubrobacteraceae bacterium TaxID=1162706 RepID=A0A6J4U3U3_9ACTN|nr:MAG: hypothetical protein AVDCRST_MAG30-4669 [uncultured Solirubrobacteraceae bacterium]
MEQPSGGLPGQARIDEVVDEAAALIAVGAQDAFTRETGRFGEPLHRLVLRERPHLDPAAAGRTRMLSPPRRSGAHQVDQADLAEQLARLQAGDREPVLRGFLVVRSGLRDRAPHPFRGLLARQSLERAGRHPRRARAARPPGLP